MLTVFLEHWLKIQLKKVFIDFFPKKDKSELKIQLKKVFMDFFPKKDKSDVKTFFN